MRPVFKRIALLAFAIAVVVVTITCQPFFPMDFSSNTAAPSAPTVPFSPPPPPSVVRRQTSRPSMEKRRVQAAQNSSQASALLCWTFSTPVPGSPRSPASAAGLHTKLCFDSQRCVGVATVRRSQPCGEAPPGPVGVALDPSSQHIILRAGPDAFRVRLEGPEVRMVRLTHRGGCVYRGRFHLTLEGEYLVEAFTVFLGFHGVADHPFARPKYTPQYIVPQNHTLRCGLSWRALVHRSAEGWPPQRCQS
eukprot:RCo040170